MEEILLKDICDLDNGYAFKSDDYVEASDTLNCRMSNIRPDGTFDILYSAKYLPNEFAEKYEDYLLNDGDLIIAMTDMAGDPKILGVPTVVDTKGYKLLLNQRVGKLRFIKPGVNADYLKLALQSKRVREYLKRFAGGGVQLNVSKKDILNAPVRMRTEEEQDYIAGLFRRILEIKKQREQELLCLDNLIKARFVEFFGNPVINEKGWNTSLLNDVCDGIGDGLHGTPEYDIDGDYPFINGNNLMDGSIEITPATKMVDEKTYKKHYIEITDNAILLSINGTLGKLAFYRGEEVMLGKSACYCNLKPEINREFVYGVMKTDAFSGFLESNSTASTIKNVGLKAIRGFSLILPPDDLQNEYVEFAKQVDKSKVAVQKALDETQTLFDSLMQEYFG